jgi:hypothetical protein
MSNDQQQFDKDAVLNRVKKMMRLANDAAASEGERDNALRMAHATLAKYNLTMAQADGHDSNPQEAREQGQMVMKDYPWMLQCGNAIAQLMFCAFFSIKGRSGTRTYCYVGKASNVFTAREMTTYVINSINAEAKRTAGRETGNTGGTYWRSFCKGAAARLAERCAEIRRTAEAAPKVPGTALVLASVYQLELKANQAFIAQELNITLRSRSSGQRNTSADAFHRGREFANGIGLNRQLK